MAPVRKPARPNGSSKAPHRLFGANFCAEFDLVHLVIQHLGYTMGSTLQAAALLNPHQVNG